MSRASQWALGSAYAYKSMPEEEQADLFNLFVAARMTDGEEHKGLLIGAMCETILAFLESRKGGVESPVSGDPLAPAPVTKKAPSPLPSSRVRDMLTPGLTPDQLLAPRVQ